MSNTTTELHGFVRACAVSDIPDTNALGVRIGNVAVAIIRGADGYHALHDVCSHAEVALSEGDVDGEVIDCWLHGSEFDLRTGKPLCLPATDPVAVYPVKLEDGVVYVDVDHPLDLSTIDQES